LHEKFSITNKLTGINCQGFLSLNSLFNKLRKAGVSFSIKPAAFQAGGGADT
jgi:hypothetical protein